MKKVFLMIAAVAALTITSCGKGGAKDAADSDSVKAETEVVEEVAEEVEEVAEDAEAAAEDTAEVVEEAAEEPAPEA